MHVLNIAISYPAGAPPRPPFPPPGLPTTVSTAQSYTVSVRLAQGNVRVKVSYGVIECVLYVLSAISYAMYYCVLLHSQSLSVSSSRVAYREI